MTDQLPKWPESLPPPTEIVEGPRQVSFVPEDLAVQDAIQDLVHDLYWFPDDQYFLYFRYGDGIGRDLNARLEVHGVEMKTTEMYFYRHPNPAHKNAFVRVMPHADVPEWQRTAARGEMYGRVSLGLQSARRKQIDFEQAARVTRDVIAHGEPVVDARPNFFGLGLNLNSVWRKIRNWARRRSRLSAAAGHWLAADARGGCPAPPFVVERGGSGASDDQSNRVE